MTAQRAYFIHLFASALNGVKPDEKPDIVSFADIYKEAVRQNLLSAVFCSVNRLDGKPDKELYDKWKTAFLRESLKSERMQSEAKELSRALADSGIPVMLLKGCVVQPLYAEPVFRSMCDIDLMYFTDDLTFQNAIYKLGYTLNTHGECHDVYIKSHYTRIEAHRKLFMQDCAYGSLFRDVQKRAEHKTDNDNLLYMTDEDAYLHLLCHAAKHYTSSGIGLRVLADVYVTQKAHRGTLDHAYLDEKLSEVGLLRFKDRLEQIAEAWFGGKEISLPQSVEDEYFLGSVYGRGETSAMRGASMKKNRVHKAKLSYYLKIIFLPKNKLTIVYPVLEKRPWLYPALTVHRWCKKLFFGRDKIKAVRHSASFINNSSISRQNEAFAYFGLTEDKIER